MRAHLAGLVVWLLATALPAQAQNLVPNPGFEDYTACPDDWDQLARVPFWTAGSCGTPDYYNACDEDAHSTPDNRKGSPHPHDGDAYAAVLVFHRANPKYHEYLQVPLEGSLVAGQQYEVSFFASLADTALYASRLGVLLRQGPNPVSNYRLCRHGPFIDATPDFVSPILSDENTWVRVVGIVTAAGGEDHLLIGNFDPQQSRVWLGAGQPSWGQAYYYVDSVSVTPVCPSGGTRLDFEALEQTGSGEVDLGATLSVGAWTFGTYTGAIGEVQTYGTSSPYYTGLPALHAPYGDPGLTLERTDLGAFDLCTMSIAEGPDELLVGELLETIDHTSSSSEYHLFDLDGVAWEPEIFAPGYTNLSQLRMLGYTQAQVESVCVCPTGSCTCSTDVEVAIVQNRFCVSGEPTGAGFQWQLDSEPAVTVASGYTANTVGDLVEVFVDSVNDDGPTLASAVQDEWIPSCFEIVFNAGYQLYVGSEAGPPSCAVVGTPGGCTFNPTILDASFLPPPNGISDVLLPVIAPALDAVWPLAAALGGFGALLLRRRGLAGSEGAWPLAGGRSSRR